MGLKIEYVNPPAPKKGGLMTKQETTYGADPAAAGADKTVMFKQHLQSEVVPSAAVEAHKPTVLVQQTEEEMLVDELVGLFVFLENAEVRKAQNRFEAIRKLLAQKVKDLNADVDEEFVFHGSVGDVVFTACKKMTVVTDKDGLLSKVEEKCGAEAVMNLVGIGITKLGKVLSEAEFAPFVQEVPGARVIMVVPKADK